MTAPAFERAEDAVLAALSVDPGVVGCDGLALQRGRIYLSGDVHFDRAALVRAVLLAIREPDEGMTEAGAQQTMPIEALGRATTDHHTPRSCWHSMLDHLLSEG